MYNSHWKTNTALTEQKANFLYSKVNYFWAPFFVWQCAWKSCGLVLCLIYVWWITSASLFKSDKFDLFSIRYIITVVNVLDYALCLLGMMAIFGYLRLREHNRNINSLFYSTLTGEIIQASTVLWLENMCITTLTYLRISIIVFSYLMFTHKWWSHKITSLRKEHIDGFSYLSYFTPEEVAHVNKELEEVFKTAPAFPPRKSDPTFGSFVSLEWSLRSDYTVPTKNPNPPPKFLKSVIDRLCNLVPEQQWDIAFVHKYEVGDGVPEHKDPHQQLGIIILAPFGDYEGGELLDCNKQIVCKKAGDMGIMRCRIPGHDRPLHEVTKVTKGVRYSLMISTLIIPDTCKVATTVWQ